MILRLVLFCANKEGENHIAIYHLSIKIISLGKGKSAVVAAAYRSGEKTTSEYDDSCLPSGCAKFFVDF
jgi:hypothetical protein